MIEGPFQFQTEFGLVTVLEESNEDKSLEEHEEELASLIAKLFVEHEKQGPIDTSSK